MLSCQRGDGEEAYGMAGSTWARDHIDIGQKFDFSPWTDKPGEDGQYLKARWGNFGQFYIASMQQMRMLESSVDRVQAVTDHYGLELSNAFENACPEACKRILKAIDDGFVGKSACDTISDEAHPSYLDSETDEARLLIEYLCGGRDGDPTALARRATLWNVLNIAERKGGLNDLDIREELYAQDTSGEIASDSLVENLRGWRAYFINELCHMACEVLLNGLTFSINDGGSGEPAALADGLVTRALQTSDRRSMPVGDLAAHLALLGCREEHASGSALAVLARRVERPEDSDLEAAIVLILSLWQRWGKDSSVQSVLAPATVAGRSALGIFEFLNGLSDQPALAALSSLIRKFVIGNHLLIAGQKLAGTGNFTYRFIVDDASMVDGFPAEYNFTTPRIGNLISFATDAGLLDDGEVTPVGKGFLRAVQPV